MVKTHPTTQSDNGRTEDGRLAAGEEDGPARPREACLRPPVPPVPMAVLERHPRPPDGEAASTVRRCSGHAPPVTGCLPADPPGQRAALLRQAHRRLHTGAPLPAHRHAPATAAGREQRRRPPDAAAAPRRLCQLRQAPGASERAQNQNGQALLPRLDQPAVLQGQDLSRAAAPLPRRPLALLSQPRRPAPARRRPRHRGRRPRRHHSLAGPERRLRRRPLQQPLGREPGALLCLARGQPGAGRAAGPARQRHQRRPARPDQRRGQCRARVAGAALPRVAAPAHPGGPRPRALLSGHARHQRQHPREHQPAQQQGRLRLPRRPALPHPLGRQRPQRTRRARRPRQGRPAPAQGGRRRGPAEAPGRLAVGHNVEAGHVACSIKKVPCPRKAIIPPLYDRCNVQTSRREIETDTMGSRCKKEKKETIHPCPQTPKNPKPVAVCL